MSTNPQDPDYPSAASLRFVSDSTTLDEDNNEFTARAIIDTGPYLSNAVELMLQRAFPTIKTSIFDEVISLPTTTVQLSRDVQFNVEFVVGRGQAPNIPYNSRCVKIMVYHTSDERTWEYVDRFANDKCSVLILGLHSIPASHQNFPTMWRQPKDFLEEMETAYGNKPVGQHESRTIPFSKVHTTCQELRAPFLEFEYSDDRSTRHLAAEIAKLVWGNNFKVPVFSARPHDNWTLCNLAGKFGKSGNSSSLLNAPRCIVQHNNLLIISDANNGLIRKISVDYNAAPNSIETIAGSVRGSQDGPASAAKFNCVTGMLVIPGSNHLLVTDASNHTIRMIGPFDSEFNPINSSSSSSHDPSYLTPQQYSTTVTTYSGTGLPGFKNGSLLDAQFDTPIAIERHATSGGYLIVDSGNHLIRLINPKEGNVSTYAGNGTKSFRDGPLLVACFDNPLSCRASPLCGFIICDGGNNVVRRMTDLEITTIAGSGRIPFIDGPANTARFCAPSDAFETVYGEVIVCDRGNGRIRKIYQGKVSTLAGVHPRLQNPNASNKNSEGLFSVSNFSSISALCPTKDGDLYIADTDNHRIAFVSVPCFQNADAANKKRWQVYEPKIPKPALSITGPLPSIVSNPVIHLLAQYLLSPDTLSSTSRHVLLRRLAAYKSDLAKTFAYAANRIYVRPEDVTENSTPKYISTGKVNNNNNDNIDLSISNNSVMVRSSFMLANENLNVNNNCNMNVGTNILNNTNNSGTNCSPSLTGSNSANSNSIPIDYNKLSTLCTLSNYSLISASAPYISIPTFFNITNNTDHHVYWSLEDDLVMLRHDLSCLFLAYPQRGVLEPNATIQVDLIVNRHENPTLQHIFRFKFETTQPRITSYAGFFVSVFEPGTKNTITSLFKNHISFLTGGSSAIKSIHESITQPRHSSPYPGPTSDFPSDSPSSIIQESNIPNPYWVVEPETMSELSRLGRGAAATVFSTRIHGVPVAVKKWDLGLKDVPPVEFEQELLTLTQFKHPKLIQFIGAKAACGQAMIVTELVSRGSLDDFLQKNGAPHEKTWKIKLKMAIDAAEGLEYLHSRGLIHRDIKSMNMLVTADLGVLVSDFGTTRTQSSVLTMGVGSFDWMSPETCNTQKYSNKSDIFSFGLVLYELLTEFYPSRLNEMVIKGDINPIPANVVAAMPEYCNLIHCCTNLNPARRPPISFVAEELRRIRNLGFGYSKIPHRPRRSADAWKHPVDFTVVPRKPIILPPDAIGPGRAQVQGKNAFSQPAGDSLQKLQNSSTSFAVSTQITMLSPRVISGDENPDVVPTPKTPPPTAFSAPSTLPPANETHILPSTASSAAGVTTSVDPQAENLRWTRSASVQESSMKVNSNPKADDYEADPAAGWNPVRRRTTARHAPAFLLSNSATPTIPQTTPTPDIVVPIPIIPSPNVFNPLLSDRKPATFDWMSTPSEMFTRDASNINTANLSSQHSKTSTASTSTNPSSFDVKSQATTPIFGSFQDDFFLSDDASPFSPVSLSSDDNFISGPLIQKFDPAPRSAPPPGTTKPNAAADNQ